MTPLVILHVVQCAGGVDRYLRMLLSNMDRERFRHILVCSGDYSRDDYQSLVYAFEQVDMLNALSPRADGKAVAAVRRLVKKYRPDVVYCHSSKGGGIGRIACIGLGVPVIYNPHGWAFSMKGSWLKSAVYLWIERLLSLFTTRFVVISNYEKMAAVQRHVAIADRIKVIFNGIDVIDIERQIASCCVTRASLGIPDDAWLVGMVGRISPQKAPDVFVRAAAEVKRRIPQAHFMIVGDGEQRAEIESMAKEYGLSDCLHITGWIDTPVAYTLLFDQAVLLSRWEGFGLVLAEYMKLGKPIVATSVDAIPDLITDYENGRLVDCGDAARAADAICEIHDNKQLRDKMIRNGQMRVAAFFDVRRTAGEHERLFVNICKSGGVKRNTLIVDMPAADRERRAAA